MEVRMLFLCLIVSLHLSVNGQGPSKWKTPFLINTHEHVRVEGGQMIYIAEDIAPGTTLGTLDYTGNDPLYIVYTYDEHNSGDIFSDKPKLFDFDTASRNLTLNKTVNADEVPEIFTWPSVGFQFVENAYKCENDGSNCVIPKIIYENVNDENPCSDPPKRTPDQQTYNIQENNKRRQDILTIDATKCDHEKYDSDMSMSIYLKGSGNIFTFTEISLNVWNLTVEENALNFEDTRIYPLEITITDHPDRYGQTRSYGPIPITINVTDEADESPTWQQYCSVKNIYEENESGIELFTVKAIDPDFGINNNIEYEIVNITDNVDNHEYNFATVDSIDNTGYVKMSKTVDRESEDYKNLPAPMSFTVRIRPKEVDSENCAGPDIPEKCVGEVMECFLSIKDKDDSAPIFKAANIYNTTLNELVGRQDIFTVSASDADLYPFDRFKVEIEDTNDPPLDIVATPAIANGNPSSTIIISTTRDKQQALDYEHTHQLKFKLKLTGEHNDTYIASEEFTIDITDMNDNTPEFEETTYTLVIKEDLSNLNKPEDCNNCIIDLDMKVTASDLDETDDFGTPSLVYSIPEIDRPEILRWLLLDPISGEFSMNTTYVNPPYNYIDIDDSSHQANHTLKIEVADCHDTESTCSSYDGIKKSTTTLNILIEDVNDEFPTLQQSPVGELCVVENGSSTPCGIGINLNDANFTAEDKDRMAHLNLQIDWTKSNATKGLRNGTRIPVSGDVWMDSLVLERLENERTKISAGLKPNPDKLLDYELVDRLELYIHAQDANATDNPQFVHQTVIINVEDTNDNLPKFEGDIVFGVIDAAKERDSTVYPISPIQASDDDKVDDYGSLLEFEIVRTDMSNVENVQVTEPFRIDKMGSQANIRLNFSPQSDIKGYFIIEVQIKDQADHSKRQNYSIIVTTPRNECYFTFNKDLATVEHNSAKIRDIFTKVFSHTAQENWLFQEIDFESIDDEQTRSTQQTRVTSYFIRNGQEEVPREYVEGAYMYSLIKLTQELQAIGLSLDSTNGMGKPDIDNDAEWNEGDTNILVGALFGVASFMLIALFATYWIRTSNLERKVKALGIEVDDERTTKTNKPDKILLAGLQENFPGSNEFAESGANPIWQVAMESTDFEENFKMDDTASESSGDSILIGVEDQRDFSTLEEVDIDVDMDLYSNLNRRRMAPADEDQNLDEGPEWSRGRLDDPPEDDSSEIYTISRPGGNPLYDSDDEEDI